MKVFRHSITTHDATLLNIGDVIISQGFWGDHELSRSVILILQHDHRGSAGVILNRQSNLMLSDVIPGLNLDSDLYYGGQSCTNKIGFLHNIKELSRSVPITEEIFWGGNIYQLNSMLQHEETDPAQVHFYAGLIEWQPGELLHEINEKKWWVDKFSADELLNMDNNGLWAYKLMYSGNLYGLLHEVPDPFLN